MPVFFVPGARQLGGAQLVVDQCLFQLKSDQDVEVVSRLVGFHTDQRRPNVVDGPIEILRRHVCQRFGESFLSVTVEALPESAAAADQVFPQARLGFMNS